MPRPIGNGKQRRRRLLSSFLLIMIAVLTVIQFLSIVDSYEKLTVTPPQLSSFASSMEPNNIRAATSTFTLADTPFCNSLEKALATGSTNDRTMIHAFVSNSGHFPFLHNVLLSMIRNNFSWKPLVLSVGTDVCSMLANVTELHGRYVCVPYLERLFHQLQRDEPESLEQIDSYLLTSDNATKSNYSARFQEIDNKVQLWGSVEHRFLINSKMYALRDILSCGADAFITDTDMAFHKDPRPYFAFPGARGDIVAQNDTNPTNYELDINSGFMYWKATADNLELIDDIIKVPPFWHIDQSRVNSRMANHSTPHTILDSYIFPNGGMYHRYRKELTDIVVFHANWSSGLEEKQKMLEDMGLWFL